MKWEIIETIISKLGWHRGNDFVPAVNAVGRFFVVIFVPFAKKGVKFYDKNERPHL